MMAAAGGDGPSGYIVGVESNNLNTNNLFVVDISDNTNPSVVGNVQYGYFRNAKAIAAYPSQERVYVCDSYNSRITCVNMSDPTNPSIAGSKNVFSSGWSPHKIGITGDVLLVYEHKNGDTDGRLSSYDLTSSLTNPTLIDQVIGTDYYQGQSAFFDNTNGKLWTGNVSDVVVLWDYSNTSNLAHLAYAINASLLDGAEPIAAVNNTAVAVETADNKFARIIYTTSFSIVNTGTPGKLSNSNGQGIRLSSDGYCYYACTNYTQSGGFYLPYVNISDAESVTGYGNISLTSLSGGTFSPCCLATDNTEDYLYLVSSESSSSGSSTLLVLDVSNRTSATEVSTTTLTGYNIFATANTICHYNP